MSLKVLLVGPSGAGKSTLLPLLAGRLGARAIDLDAEIEAMAGCTVSEIFEREGEAGFRLRERAALEALGAAPGPWVAALGAGALDAPGSAEIALALGPVVHLTAAPETLWARVSADGGRPIARTGEAAFLARQLPREETYRAIATGGTWSTDAPAPEALAEALETTLGDAPERVPVAVEGAPYVVTLAPGVLAGLPEVLPGAPGPCLVVTDDGVPPAWARRAAAALAAAGWAPAVVAVPAGEATKSPDAAAWLWGEAARAGLLRHSPIVAVGGGMVGDLAGFVAATYMRGVPFVQVPTTLLAMVDSSVGGKVAVNLPEGKNLVGAFHQPVAVLADPLALTSLPPRAFAAGLAEILKIATIADAGFFDALTSAPEDYARAGRPGLTGAIARAVALKAGVVAADPFERAGRVALNFGHTVGHAIEAVFPGRFEHGEAVALGMRAEAALARAAGRLDADTAERLERALAAWGLPRALPEAAAPDVRAALWAAMRRDKKNAAARSARFVLPGPRGAWSLADLEADELGRAWTALTAVRADP